MKQWLEKFRHMKKDQILILLLTGILLLVIAVPAEPSDKSEISVGQAVPETEYAQPDMKERLEQQLQALLEQVDGVGEARVMITLQSDGKKIVEKDLEQSHSQDEGNGEGQVSSSQSAQSSEATVYQKDSQGNEIPYVTEQKTPEIAGVLVIARGGGNASVQQEITEAVMALFGVEAHKIKVMRMK